MPKEQKKILRIDSEEARQSELTEEFKSVVKQVMKDLNIKKDSPELRACPDMFVGKIENLHKSSSFSYCKITDTPNAGMVNQEGRKAILLILESPHKEEYKEEPIEPAKGCTGCAIRTYFRQIFGDDCNSYDLVLLNLVQYQCSQGMATRGKKSIKNTVLAKLLEGAPKENIFVQNFVERVRAAMRIYETCVIINACPFTKINNQELNKQVDAWLNSALGSSAYKLISDAGHPSAWCKNWKNVKRRVAG
jgi:hypothetical protein